MPVRNWVEGRGDRAPPHPHAARAAGVVWYRGGSWFARTTRGLYAWGWNVCGRLGVDDQGYHVRRPRRVLIDGDVLDVSLIPCVSFFRTASGWHGCGSNLYGQLGVGHTDDYVTDDDVATPTPIPGSEGVTRWGGDENVTFAFTAGGLLACGINSHGQCGVGSTDDMITTLTPVALSDYVKGRVDRVVCGRSSSFIIAGRRCFAAGLNRDGELGVGSNERVIRTPTKMPIHVDDFISSEELTIIRSGDTLLACGDNRHRQISTDEPYRFTTPIPLDLPGPAVKVIIDIENLFVKLEDGAWFGRGKYDSDYFIPVPDADLIHLLSCRLVPGWTPVSDDRAENMNTWTADDHVMFLPEPSRTRDRRRCRRDK